MIEDIELLRRFVAERDQDAFTELVRRRVDLVYSVAVRQVGGDAHLAQDVTQKVFADLARKAPSLIERPVLAGWLYRSAQFAASDVVRSERRRRAREQETYAMQDVTTTGEAAADWDRLRPLLDEAMGDLSEPDRDAVALRFFEGRPFADIGRALRLPEDTARKRVERALDKMAAALSRRGVTSTSAALGAALVGQAGFAAPAGLAASVAGTALAGVGSVAVGAVAATGFWAAIGSTTATVSAGALAAVAIGVATYSTREANQRDAELAALAQQHASAQARVVETEQQLRQTTQRLAASEQRFAAAEDDNALLLEAIQDRGGPSGAATIARPVETNVADGPVTREMVESRYRRAQQLARNGDPAEALQELLWCFDVGMTTIESFGAVRTSFLLGEIERLGRRYPKALDALRERRDKAEARMQASESDFEATSTFGAINRALKEFDRTLVVFDRLPLDDRRRRTLGGSAFDHFVDVQRYQDAVAGRSFTFMLQQFERSAEERPLPPNIPNPEELRKGQRKALVRTTARHVEVLAGSGNLEQARTLAEKVLAYEKTAETRAVLQQHLERAGQPRLLQPGG